MKPTPAERTASLPTTLRKAERILVDADTLLLDLSEEIGRGRRVGLDADTVMQILAISREIGKVTALLFASDDVAPALLAVH
jgi:hypothetical protein